MSLTQLIRILWARRLQFFWICVSVLMLALLATAILPKKYAAESAIVVDISNTDPLATNTGGGGALAQLQPTYLATQMDVISSHNVALKVVDKENLTEYPFFKHRFMTATDGKGSIRDWIADNLLDHLKVRTSHNGNVIYIQYSSTSPEFASKIAEDFAQRYIQATVELKVDPARRQSGWFDQQIKDLRNNLENAQAKLSTYQKSHGVIGTDDARIDAENTRLEELSKQLVTAQSAMYETSAREQQMSQAASLNHADELSDVMKSPLLQNLKTELARAEANFADVSQRFDRNHPQYLSAAAELASLQKKVATEINNARETVAREAVIARHQATDLQRSVDAQRARILSLKQTQDEYSVLKREADNARTAYENAMQRGSETHLESKLDQANVAILNHATTPVLPASPRLFLNLILALLFGPLLAMGICLASEMSDRRVHSADDLLSNGLSPVLMEVPPRSTNLSLNPKRLRAKRSVVARLHEKPAT